MQRSSGCVWFTDQLLERVPPNRRCANRPAAPPLREQTSTVGRVRDRRQAGPQSFGSFRRVRTQSRRAIEQVLRRVVGGISDEGLWVDDEPGLAFRSEDVACVQVGSQHDFSRFSAWQLRKEVQTFAD
jgi:hypothetical protein